jgi:hypothetical protein
MKPPLLTNMMNHVLQFANIARPRVSMEPFERGIRQRGRRDPQAFRVALEKVLDQRPDVARPLAQGQQAQFDDVQPVIQIFPKVPGAYRGFEVHIGRGD